MPRLKVAELLAASPEDPQRHLDPKQVEKYRRSIDQMPPVVVFETEDGLLLADGYHRLAAALAEGRETVEAEVRRGSRHDALAYAVALGAAQRHLPAEDVENHVLKRSGR
jgi:ParB-like chromosome segregation protein Spo0J